MENKDKIIGVLGREKITIEMYEGREKITLPIRDFFIFLQWVQGGCITKR